MQKSNEELGPLGAFPVRAFVTAIIIILIILAALLFGAATAAGAQSASFRFVSIGDGQGDATRLATTLAAITPLDPAFVLFNGDLENDGVTTSEMNAMTGALKSAGLYNRTFAVRGNHDNHVSGSAALWESYFETAPNIRVLPSGVTNYTSIDASNDTLTYSFEYGNSMFIGLDVPGGISGNISAAEYAFLENRLTTAEAKGLTHAFIFFHGPEYCVESVHCSCTGKADGSCTPAAWVTFVNKHPIISATFHGHEHILGWTHLDKYRVAGLTGSYEQIMTSPSGGWSYNSYIYPLRMDYFYDYTGGSTVFASVDVNGLDFTVNLYKVGTTTPVWSKTFTKGSAPNTPAITNTATQPQPSRTPTKTATPGGATATPGAAGRLKYFMADRVVTAADFAKLAGWGINSVVISFDVNGSVTKWRTALQNAQDNGMGVVILPSDWTHPRTNCTWESPYPRNEAGDISRVQNLMNVAAEYTSWIGIVNSHESFSNCPMSFNEQANVKDKLKAYAATRGRPDIKVWNYINSLYDETIFPSSEIPRVMDVAVIWLHFAGGAEGTFTQAKARILRDRARLANIPDVELVYLMQTFITIKPWDVKFTPQELESYSCQIIALNALDGFNFYTWGADWWSDLGEWTAWHATIPRISNCAAALPTVTPQDDVTPTVTRTATLTRTATATRTPTPSRTATPPIAATHTPECYTVAFTDGTKITVCK